MFLFLFFYLSFFLLSFIPSWIDIYWEKKKEKGNTHIHKHAQHVIVAMVSEHIARNQCRALWQFIVQCLLLWQWKRLWWLYARFQVSPSPLQRSYWFWWVGFSSLCSLVCLLLICSSFFARALYRFFLQDLLLTLFVLCTISDFVNGPRFTQVDDPVWIWFFLCFVCCFAWINEQLNIDNSWFCSWPNKVRRENGERRAASLLRKKATSATRTTTRCARSLVKRPSI